ncbi:hypothetical protein E4U54_002831 [Claviceps lovelessii]|nr:hypothetical protein E4U54_002831 [Claviceps lovelessii]
MASNKGLDSELESFRQQWLSEVRTKQGTHLSSSSSSSSTTTTTTHADELVSPTKPKARSRGPSPSNINTRKAAPAIDIPSHEQDESSSSHPHGPFEDDVGTAAAAAASAEPPSAMVDGSVRASAPLGKQLVSALDHYEEAMAKEAEGNMGDSLKLYRQAYRPQPHLGKTRLGARSRMDEFL